MKRIKLAQNQFITLTQISTNAGKPHRLEIARTVDSNPVPVIKSFYPDSLNFALFVFDQLSLACSACHRLRPDLLNRIITGQASTRLGSRRVRVDKSAAKLG